MNSDSKSAILLSFQNNSGSVFGSSTSVVINGKSEFKNVIL